MIFIYLYLSQTNKMSSTNKKNIKSSFPTKKEIIEFYKKNNRWEEENWKMCELPISLNKNLTIIQLKNTNENISIDICNINGKIVAKKENVQANIKLLNLALL